MTRLLRRLFPRRPDQPEPRGAGPRAVEAYLRKRREGRG